MNMFHIIEGGTAVLRSKGVWKQAKVYRFGNDVFVGWGGGYIKLARHSGTSKPDVSWIGVEGPGISIIDGLPGFRTAAEVRASLRRAA